jgi:ribose transport system ATP-binding protein
MGLTVDLTALVTELPLPTLRMIDLARALSYDPQLLLLDEITASLPSDLADTVTGIVRDFRESGRSVLFISHRLAEVSALCDRATVLRDGRAVGTLVPRAGQEERMVELMLGQSRDTLAAGVEAATAAADTEVAAVQTEAEPGKTVLEVRGLRLEGQPGQGVDFEVRAGEIVGVAALEGQGQDELFALLAGERKLRDGEITVNGRPLKARHPYDAIRAGMVLVPADRMMALLPQRPIAENIAAPLYNRIARWGPINMRRERDRVGDAISKLQIDTRAASQARRLSGGNRQKLTLARWLAAGFQVMLCFDPTRGIDVGTKRQIYVLLRELADAGAAILLFTSELPEIQLVCDRAIVLYQGSVSDRLPAREADEGRLLRAAHGLVEEAA